MLWVRTVFIILEVAVLCCRFVMTETAIYTCSYIYYTDICHRLAYFQHRPICCAELYLNNICLVHTITCCDKSVLLLLSLYNNENSMLPNRYKEAVET